MKKASFLVLGVFALGSLAFAQKVAIGPLVAYTGNTVNDGSDTARKADIDIGIAVPIFLSPGFEVDPEFIVTFYSEKDPGAINGTITDDYSRVSFSVGAGAYWTLLGSGVISIKSGVYASGGINGKPTGDDALAYDKYFSPAFFIGAPIILDLNLGERLILRISNWVVGINWYGTYYTIAGTETNTDNFTLWPNNGFGPRFSFFVKL